MFRSLPGGRRIKKLLLIGTGWTTIGLGVLVAPLPGPFGLPIVLIGSGILLRHSPESRRLYVRLRRRFPRVVRPAERWLRRKRPGGSAPAS